MIGGFVIYVSYMFYCFGKSNWGEMGLLWLVVWEESKVGIEGVVRRGGRGREVGGF